MQTDRHWRQASEASLATQLAAQGISVLSLALSPSFLQSSDHQLWLQRLRR